MAITVTGIMIIATTLCGMIALCVYHIRRIRLYIAAAKFPGPPTLPIFGNALYFYGDAAYIMRQIMGITKIYPSPYRLWQGSRLYIVVTDPAQLKVIFSSQKCLEKNDEFLYWRPMVGAGLLTAPLKTWRNHRKLVMPAFNSKILATFVEKFAKYSDIMVKDMEKELNGGEFDILPYSFIATVESVFATNFDMELNLGKDEKLRFVKVIEHYTEVVALRSLRPWLQFDFIYNRTKDGKTQKKLLKYYHEVMNYAIESMKNAHKKRSLLSNDGSQSRIKILSEGLLESLESNVGFTEQEFRDEINTATVAGSETTAIALRFVTLMLANFPELQERAYQELRDIYPDKISLEKPVKTEDLDRMDYLKRVIQETLRIYPTIPWIPRKVTEEMALGDYTLPAGTSVLVSVISLHRSEKYWPDPWKFDPDRFLPEEVAKRHPYCYIPFSAGARNCVGYKYAMMSLTVMLATILRRYELKVDEIVNIEDLEMKIDVFMKPMKPFKIRISERSSIADHK